ncbi:diguanylate cyclase domain-containing protein [Actinokineospora soli]|uniref:Diguanylate cyclase domain-containing protein n=1 Tax=Actinokineospora soli TaxID=1048753 RepID=A0ABW2TWU4_9PSEU
MTGWDEVAASAPVGLAVVDTSGQVVTANPRCAALLGLTPTQLRTGARPRGWEVRDDTGSRAPALADLAAQAARCAASVTLALEAGVPGATHRLWADFHPLGEARVALVVRPVETEPARATGLLDPVTGLPGRALFLDRVGQALAGSGPVGVVLADVRGLTAVNARFGFAGGDHLLADVADRLRTGIDATVARYAGRTFGVLGRGDPEALAARVLAVADAPAEISGSRVDPHLRVGWAAERAACTRCSSPPRPLCAHSEGTDPGAGCPGVRPVWIGGQPIVSRPDRSAATACPPGRARTQSGGPQRCPDPTARGSAPASGPRRGPGRGCPRRRPRRCPDRAPSRGRAWPGRRCGAACRWAARPCR